MLKYEPFDWYDQALYYDMIFDQGTDEEASFLEAVHAQYVQTRGRRVLEPACGSGRLVIALADRGFNVTGFDLADGMVKYAREALRDHGLSGSRARVTKGDMTDFAFRQPFDMAHCLVSTFKLLPTEDAARAHLRCVADALKPGGVYVLGLHLDDYDNEGVGRERWVAQRNGLHVTCNIQGWPADRRSRTAKLRSRMVVRENGHIGRYETHFTFRTYSLRQLKSLLRSVPEFEHVGTYDFNHDIEYPTDFDGDQTDNVLILRKVRKRA